MSTNELIDLLSADVERVDRRRLTLEFSSAVMTGVAVAIMATILGLGIRSDLAEPDAAPLLILKLAFTLSIVIISSGLLAALIRPGGERRVQPAPAAIPFIAVVLLAAASVVAGPSPHWRAMIIGDTWLECLLFVPLIAVLPFTIIVLAVRQIAAPTDLTRTGAFAGLLAGSVSAMGYALHGTEDFLPFVALWYGLTIVLCTLAGALLGPHVLRW